MGALANHGGGYLVFGFNDDLTHDQNRPSSLEKYNRDTFAGIAKRYLTPSFQYDVFLVTHSNGNEFFVVRVPGHKDVPIAAKADGPQDGRGRPQGIVKGTYYIRKPGPESAAISGAEEWSPLIRRCVLENRDQLLSDITSLLQTRVTRGPTGRQQLEEWHNDSERRFLDLLSQAERFQWPVPLEENCYQLSYLISASEPQLLLEIMSRHDDWCALVCLVGGGQEINAGEEGVAGWGDALRNLAPDVAKSWQIHAPRQIVHGDNTTGGLGLGNLPECMAIHDDDALSLRVPLRSYRSPRLADWVDAILRGAAVEAVDLSRELSRYPIVLSRSLDDARRWLRSQGRGRRRFGLVASSGARRLRAEGLGVSLNATDGDKIAHWYLEDSDDIRSSMALEVTANEYTSQGLELDFVGVCWGGDFLRHSETGTWMARRLQGPRWARVRDQTRQRFTRNSYRVLLTRAREGMVLWVPRGDPSDPTRSPDALDATADFLVACGVERLEST